MNELQALRVALPPDGQRRFMLVVIDESDAHIVDTEVSIHDWEKLSSHDFWQRILMPALAALREQAGVKPLTLSRPN